MLSFQGYFEKGKFISINTVPIPERKRAIVTILDEEAPEVSYSKAWREFLSALKDIDGEEIPQQFERASFKREVEL